MNKNFKTLLWALGIGVFSLTEAALGQAACNTLCPGGSTSNDLGSGISVVRIVNSVEVPVVNSKVRPGDTLKITTRVIYVPGARAVLAGTTLPGSDWRIRAFDGVDEDGDLLEILDIRPVGFAGTIIGATCGGVNEYETSTTYVVPATYTSPSIFFETRFRGRYFDGACSGATKIDGLTLTVDPCVGFDAEEAADELGLDTCQNVTCDPSSANTVALSDGNTYGYVITGEPCCTGFDGAEAEDLLIAAGLMDKCQEVDCDSDSDVTIELENGKTYGYVITGETCCEGFDEELARGVLGLPECVVITCDPDNLGTESQVVIGDKTFGYSLDDSECGGVSTGCNTEFWKCCPHNWSDTGFTRTELVSNTFPTVTDKIGKLSLSNALCLQGGNSLFGSRALLMRAAVTALLNAGKPALNYPLSKEEIQSVVNSVYHSTNRAEILALCKELEGYNTLGCQDQDGISLRCKPPGK
jgi:hypothetical protein